jgi:hypothetical protein
MGAFAEPNIFGGANSAQRHFGGPEILADSNRPDAIPPVAGFESEFSAFGRKISLGEPCFAGRACHCPIDQSVASRFSELREATGCGS